MNKPVVFMFSGQGSQYYNMGKELFIEHPVFREWIFKLDRIAREIIGESILEQLYSQKKRKYERFDRTLYTHPAIFMVEYALARVLLESGVEPDYVLGASMGDFVSAVVAGVMGVEETLELVLKQAELFEGCCREGGMLAIIHDTNLYYETPLIYENSELGSVNFNLHFVISGKNERLKMIGEFLEEKKILYQDLPVSFAFHSSLIDPAEIFYINFLKKYILKNPQIPMVSCLYGKLITSLSNDYFWNIAREPIQFSKAIYELENFQSYIYLDLGPSGTLANFTKRNLDKNSESEVYAVITPFDQEFKNLEKIKKCFADK